MNDADRFGLLGTYRTPRFRYGKTVVCEVRGEVTIVGLSAGPIPWPIGKRGRARSLVVYQGLAKAVRREAEHAVAHWWGITEQTVWKWRRALGVGATTEGTSWLRHDCFEEPWARRARQKALAKARDPERREKIAASKRGKPRPPHVIEALRRANVDSPPSAGARRKMSEAHRRRGLGHLRQAGPGRPERTSWFARYRRPKRHEGRAGPSWRCGAAGGRWGCRTAGRAGRSRGGGGPERTGRGGAIMARCRRQGCRGHTPTPSRGPDGQEAFLPSPPPRPVARLVTA
jgi:hypothetical protein